MNVKPALKDIIVKILLRNLYLVNLEPIRIIMQVIDIGVILAQLEPIKHYLVNHHVISVLWVILVKIPHNYLSFVKQELYKIKIKILIKIDVMLVLLDIIKIKMGNHHV